MRSLLSLAIAAGLLAALGTGLSGCVSGDRALSLMDTGPIHGNMHPHLVLKDGEVVYSETP
jgi:hypothetical protein